MSLRILIGGDYYVSEDYSYEKAISDGLKSSIEGADFVLFNLEAPVIDGTGYFPIPKTGPNLKMKEPALFPLSQLNTSHVTLANNHILDYGVEGLRSTLEVLDSMAIGYLGAGLTREQKVAPLIVEADNLKVGILNFCENEWSTYNLENQPGCNAYDPARICHAVREIRKTVDYCILVIHGGSEYCNVPSPRMVSDYRMFCTFGADLVVGHHQHCLCGYEDFGSSRIYYGLGNFLFTIPNTRPEWYTGMCVNIDLSKVNNLKVSLEEFPVFQTPTFQVHCGDAGQKGGHREKLENLCRLISEPEILQREWRNYVSDRREVRNLMLPFAHFPVPLIRKALQKTGLNAFLANKPTSMQITNHMRCESHRDVMNEQLITNK